jgi:hypothetical protein
MDPDGFWGKEGHKLQWIKPFTKVKDTSFELHNFHIDWFEDGTLERLRQLHRPPPLGARQPDRHHLGRR